MCDEGQKILHRQGNKMAKVKFSHDIEESLRKEFDTLAEQLPGKKHEVVEAMIVAFKTLPGPLQEKILSKRPEVRAAALAVLAGLQVPEEPGKSTRRLSTAKVG